MFKFFKILNRISVLIDDYCRKVYVERELKLNKTYVIIIEIFTNCDGTCELFYLQGTCLLRISKNGEPTTEKYSPKTLRESIGIVKKYYNITSRFSSYKLISYSCERKNI